MSKAKQTKEQMPKIDLSEIMNVTEVSSNDVRVRCKHAVESNLIFGLNSGKGILEALSPVEVKFGDPGLKIPFDRTMRVLIGYLIECKGGTMFRVIPVNELRKLRDLIRGGYPMGWKWGTVTLEDLHALVRTSWSAASPLVAPHSTELERKQFIRAQEARGAEFIQMTADAVNSHDAKWGIDHVVYPFETVFDKSFLPVYVDRKDSQKPYDFGHGHVYICNQRRKEA